MRPEVIVYPFGKYSSVAIRCARDLGLRLGFTIGLRKQPLPIDLDDDGCMTLPRYPIFPNSLVERQCELTRLDWRPLRRVRNLWKPRSATPAPVITGRASSLHLR